LPHAGSGVHAAADGAELTSPLQGTVVRVAVTPGTPVRRGDLICVVEAMKMENEISAHREGTVVAVHVEPGHAVRIGTVLATIAP
jgi:acetyl-CoA/propionyl-CoA carboxylase biotin carboxyl carrier protein